VDTHLDGKQGVPCSEQIPDHRETQVESLR